MVSANGSRAGAGMNGQCRGSGLRALQRRAGNSVAGHEARAVDQGRGHGSAAGAAPSARLAASSFARARVGDRTGTTPRCAAHTGQGCSAIACRPDSVCTSSACTSRRDCNSRAAVPLARSGVDACCTRCSSRREAGERPALLPWLACARHRQKVRPQAAMYKRVLAVQQLRQQHVRVVCECCKDAKEQPSLRVGPPGGRQWGASEQRDRARQAFVLLQQQAVSCHLGQYRIRSGFDIGLRVRVRWHTRGSLAHQLTIRRAMPEGAPARLATGPARS